MGILQKDIDDFHATIKARALLILIEWAGSQAELARRLQITRSTVQMWATREGISAPCAWLLGRIPGCPLTAAEIRPDIKHWTAYDLLIRKVQCGRCRHYLIPAKLNPSSLSYIKGVLKASRRVDRSLTNSPLGRSIEYNYAALHNVKSKPKRERIANSKS